MQHRLFVYGKPSGALIDSLWDGGFAVLTEPSISLSLPIRNTGRKSALVVEIDEFKSHEPVEIVSAGMAVPDAGSLLLAKIWTPHQSLTTPEIQDGPTKLLVALSYPKTAGKFDELRKYVEHVGTGDVYDARFPISTRSEDGYMFTVDGDPGLEPKLAEIMNADHRLWSYSTEELVSADKADDMAERERYMDGLRKRLGPYADRAAAIPPGEIGSAEWYGEIGRYWLKAREDARISRYEMAARLEIDVNELRFFEVGIPQSLDSIRDIAPLYAQALGMPELYAEFSRKFHVE